MTEEWRAVVGAEGRLEVSDLGRVRSVERKVMTGRWGGTVRTVPSKIIRTQPGDGGYLGFAHKVGGKVRRFYVHRCVLEAFEGPAPSPEHRTRHLDGNPARNVRSNLAWGTRQENEADKVLHGTAQIGEGNPAAKLTAARVAAIKARLNAGESGASLAREFNVTPTQISRIRLGQSWGHVVAAT